MPRSPIAPRIRRLPGLAGALIVFLAAHFPTYAQPPTLMFETLSVEQGLSQSIVVSIIQDSRGFLWFGTEDGLNLYDGYSFTVLRSDPTDPLSLSYNQISCIHEDRDGVIWVGTYTGGLNRFILRKNAFVHFRARPFDSTTISSDLVTALVTDRMGNLWVGTDRGLTRMSPGTDHSWASPRIHRISSSPSDGRSLPSNLIRGLALDSTGALWIATDRGLACLPAEELTNPSPVFVRYAHDPRDTTSLSQDSVRSLLVDRSGTLWVGTEGGLNKAIRLPGGGVVKGFQRFLPGTNQPYTLSHPSVFALFEDAEGILWVGTNGGGLNRLDPSTGRFFHYVNDSRNPHSLSYNEIRSIFQDRSGLLWVGTYGRGVNKVDARQKPFLLYRPDPINDNSLNQQIIWSIYEDADGVLWIGTHGGGLNRYDRRRNRFTHYQSVPSDPATLSSDFVRLIIGDPSGALWIGTNGGGVCRFDPQTGRARRFLADPADSTSLSHNEIRSLSLDPQGVLWIGTHGGGLNTLDTRSLGTQPPRFTRYRYDPADTHSIGADIVREIQQDRSGRYWIATQGGGLNMFDPQTRRFTRHRAVPSDPAALSSDYIMGLRFDREGTLWVATWGGGLNRFDTKTGRVRRFLRRDGLPGDAVYAILEDHTGSLWLSTNNGLSRLNPRDLSIRNYSMRDGLQSSEFNAGAYFQSPSGEMFFGGINGFNAFFPDSILDNTHVPPIVITAFRKLNKEVRFDRPVSEVQEIELSYRDYHFSFEFAALDFTAPEKNQYAYRMEGLDEDWIHTTADKRYAHYTTLKPGDYLFRVKGSNNDGVWNEQGVSIRIRITPPVWETLWFRGAAILGIGLAGFVLFRRRVRTVRMKTELRAAHDTQMSIMPQHDPAVSGCDVSGICLPANEVGGDFFDYFLPADGDGGFGIVVGDVAGKAMRAAMTAVLASGMVSAQAARGRRVAEMLRSTNRLIFPRTDRRMFTAMCILIVHPDRRAVTFANAGLVRPVHLSGGEARMLESAGSPHPLGMVQDTVYEDTTIPVRPGDIILLHTDGVTEAQDANRHLYGEERLQQTLQALAAAHVTAREIRDGIISDVRRFVGSAPQHDDMTVVVLRVLAGAGAG